MTGTVIWLIFSVIALLVCGIFIFQEAMSCIKSVLELLQDFRKRESEVSGNEYDG